MLDALDEAGQAVEDFYDLYTRDGLEYYLGFGEDLGDIGGESDEEGEGDEDEDEKPKKKEVKPSDDKPAGDEPK